MPNERRFVLDTNLVVSALLLRNSVARRAFDKATQTGLVLLSQAVLVELVEVLQRKDFDKYITEDERLEFLAGLVQASLFIESPEPLKICRDPKDDCFLSLAVSGQAQTLITGDQDLLVLNPFRGVAVMTPRQFLDESP